MQEDINKQQHGTRSVTTSVLRSRQITSGSVDSLHLLEQRVAWKRASSSLIPPWLLVRVLLLSYPEWCRVCVCVCVCVAPINKKSKYIIFQKTCSASSGRGKLVLSRLQSHELAPPQPGWTPRPHISASRRCVGSSQRHISVLHWDGSVVHIYLAASKRSPPDMQKKAQHKGPT